MRPWMLPIDDFSSTRKRGGWLTEGILAEHLASVQSDMMQPNEPTLKPSRISLESSDAFRFYDEEANEVEGAEAVDGKEQSFRTDSAEHRKAQLDLKTFCILFDRLILVYNS